MRTAATVSLFFLLCSCWWNTPPSSTWRRLSDWTPGGDSIANTILVNAFFHQHHQHHHHKKPFAQSRRRHTTNSFSTTTTTAAAALLHATQKRGDDEIGDAKSNNDDATFLAALKARRFELDKEKYVLEQKWRNADCSSGISAALPDWVRRLDVDYPLLACGSAKQAVYVTHLETGQIIAATGMEEAATEVEGEEEVEKPEGIDTLLRLLFGSYDGGGTLAIAFKGDMICVANREGSVQIYRLDVSSLPSSSSTRPQQQQKQQLLVSQGVMGALKGIIVTCLHLDDEYLWVGTGNGNLHAYALDSDLPLVLQAEPEMQWSFGSSPVLSIDLCPEIGCGVATTSSGSVELILMDGDTDHKSIASLCPPFNSNVRRSSNSYPLCATIVQHPVGSEKEEEEEQDDERMCYSIACGGNDGSIWLQRINTDGVGGAGGIDKDNPFSDSLEEMRPNHLGRVKCLASPLPGLLVSGGLDGTMRIWDVKDRETLYQFVGYKVWLGSLWTDGSRLVSDGSDNTVIVHDFGKDSDEPQEE